MSISSIGGSSGCASALHLPSQQPPDMSKDQLTELQSKLKSEGKDTANLDKVIDDFDRERLGRFPFWRRACLSVLRLGQRILHGCVLSALYKPVR